ncbi:hypothetical protein H5410_006379 [Solanum commersonii]|uniref:Uncharacterized protein n=1 Tax=Solanum commersonii TaxID=4109 RepID=A0A9J6A9J8_SOLCO|nr:hypothetical protein H5410_006379 [Solanum commersonii]
MENKEIDIESTDRRETQSSRARRSLTTAPLLLYRGFSINAECRYTSFLGYLKRRILAKIVLIPFGVAQWFELGTSMLEVSSSKPLASESKGFAFWVELVAPGLVLPSYIPGTKGSEGCSGPFYSAYSSTNPSKLRNLSRSIAGESAGFTRIIPSSELDVP